MFLPECGASVCAARILLTKVPCRQVTLLSGRSCSQIFDIAVESVEDVLRQSAELLDMDADTVARNGALMIGSTDIKHLKDCTSEQLGKLQPLLLLQQKMLHALFYSAEIKFRMHSIKICIK